ncbi:hypothetical protein ACFVTY_08105 [Streptomyces sp. NPDC058067]|uniref:hypothetical protein n=1 Tax=Streptomyces sp. NPDC058067 TaxID=3346324 RepID=UPI0036E53826
MSGSTHTYCPHCDTRPGAGPLLRLRAMAPDGPYEREFTLIAREPQSVRTA